MAPGTVWIDLTSAAFELGGRFSELAATRGVEFLDAPIGGGVAAMLEGTAALYVGGHGIGYLTKLLINLLWFGQATHDRGAAPRPATRSAG